MKKLVSFTLGLFIIVLSASVYAGNDEVDASCAPTPLADYISVHVSQPLDFYCATACQFRVAAYTCTIPPVLISAVTYVDGTYDYQLPLINDYACVCVKIVAAPSCTCTPWHSTVDCKTGGYPFSTFNITFTPY